jgi:nucleotide-binding universal stress UspA family protein
MFKNVLVGIDEREGGRDAIALAEQLVGNGELTLAYVHGGYPGIARGSDSKFEASEHDRALALLAAAKARAGVDASVATVGASSVGRGLHQLAESRQADLLVIGSTRHGLLGRVLVGNDTRHALNGAPCALAIAPARYAQQPNLMAEIGVAYNESPESDHALEFARSLARETGAKVSAFETVTLPAYALMGGGAMIPDLTDGLLAAARKRIAGLGDDIEPQVAYGVPVEELTEYSASLDLLVVGSRGYGPVGRLVHGSVSQRLASSARCPLLVLARATRATRATEAGDAENDDVLVAGA